MTLCKSVAEGILTIKQLLCNSIYTELIFKKIEKIAILNRKCISMKRAEPTRKIIFSLADPFRNTFRFISI